MGKTQESYNQSAAKYNEKFSQHSPYYKQIGRFIEKLPPKATVLDMGCGTGLNSKMFAQAGHGVYGFDFSESMRKIVKENCPSGSFTTESIENYSCDRRFQALCLSFIIVYLQDEVVIDLIKRLSTFLDGKGLVYISFMTGKTAGYETTSFSDSEIYFNYFDPQWIMGEFKKNGFSLESSEREPYKEQDGSITEDIFLIFKKNLS